MKNNFKVTVPLAILVTFLAIIYQRSTGPTYPRRIYIGEGDNEIMVKFPRSHGGKTDAPIEIPKIEKGMTGKIWYRRYPTNTAWKRADLIEGERSLTFSLPHQPPAGKITYHLELYYGGKTQKISSKDDPIYIRYKGAVPTWILAPHIFFMFIAMMFSSLALFEAISKTQSFARISYVTTACLICGGLVLGPLVQKYAFGVYWAGFPYDWDLTDNKLLITFLFWFAAALVNFRKPRIWVTVLAAIVQLMMYSIPHSMKGSEYNYEEGKVITKDGY